MCTEVLSDGAYGVSSLSEKISMSKPFADEIREATLSPLLFKDPECWSGRGLSPRASSR